MYLICLWNTIGRFYLGHDFRRISMFAKLSSVLKDLRKKGVWMKETDLEKIQRKSHQLYTKGKRRKDYFEKKVHH